jgi:hypothetical protein
MKNGTNSEFAETYSPRSIFHSFEALWTQRKKAFAQRSPLQEDLKILQGQIVKEQKQKIIRTEKSMK